MLTTVIGAFPKPAFLKITDWFNAAGGTDTANPTKFYEDEIKRMGSEADDIFFRAAKQVILDQEECGIDIITDGEVRRENYIHHHCRYINGIDFDYLTKKTARTGNYDCYLPTVISKVKFTEPFLDKEFQINQKNSTKPVKITLPGPLTITDTIADNFYFNDKNLGIDLSNVINEEVKALADAGCKYIQIDEPLFARKPTEANDFGIENLERCFHGVSNDVEKIVHICCGYPDKIDSDDYPKAPLHSYNDIAINLEDSTVDTISIEDAHRHNDLKLLEFFKTKKIIFGLIKIASSEIENIDEIRSRAFDCLNHIDKERLIAAPDCGMGYLSREMAIQKLENLNKAVKSI